MEPFCMPRFDGICTKVDFKSYKTKLMTVGALKDGLQLAYLKDLKINLPGTTPPDLNLIANEKLKSTAMFYLILSTEGVPQNLIKPAGDNPYHAWKLITVRYQPNTMGEYVKRRWRAMSWKIPMTTQSY